VSRALELENGVAESTRAAGEATLELTHCHLMRHSGARINEIGNCLRLQQIHPAIDDCPPCELSRKRLARSGGG
jgi:hypothetical protein